MFGGAECWTKLADCVEPSDVIVRVGHKVYGERADRRQSDAAQHQSQQPHNL